MANVPGADELRGDHGRSRRHGRTRQIVPLVETCLNHLAELNHHDVGQRISELSESNNKWLVKYLKSVYTDLFGAAVGIAVDARDPEDVSSTASSPDKALSSIVVFVSVNSASEVVWRPQGENHSVFRAGLRDVDAIGVSRLATVKVVQLGRHEVDGIVYV